LTAAFERTPPFRHRLQHQHSISVATLYRPGDPKKRAPRHDEMPGRFFRETKL
jgi:hypothetical protein